MNRTARRQSCESRIASRRVAGEGRCRRVRRAIVAHVQQIAARVEVRPWPPRTAGDRVCPDLPADLRRARGNRRR